MFKNGAGFERLLLCRRAPAGSGDRQAGRQADSHCVQKRQWPASQSASCCFCWSVCCARNTATMKAGYQAGKLVRTAGNEFQKGYVKGEREREPASQKRGETLPSGRAASWPRVDRMTHFKGGVSCCNDQALNPFSRKMFQHFPLNDRSIFAIHGSMWHELTSGMREICSELSISKRTYRVSHIGSRCLHRTIFFFDSRRLGKKRVPVRLSEF